MKRIQLFEFEDQAWFPDWIRRSLTNLLVVLSRWMGIGAVLADLIAGILKDKKLNRIVDLGSGSGGAMPEVMKLLAEKHELHDVQFIMTDLYPNPETIQHFKDSGNKRLQFFEHPVDATQLATAPAGLKTMINCFHHMPPDIARKILSSAQQHKQPFLIYELAENNIPLLVWALFLPFGLVILFIISLFMTPFVRPLTLRQLFFTYLIPIIPITYAWDGQASLPRMYSMSDLDELLKDLTSNEYVWKKGIARGKNGKKAGTYVLGLPV